MKATDKALVAAGALFAAALIGVAAMAAAPSQGPEAQSAGAPNVPAYSKYDAATAEYTEDQWVLVLPNAKFSALSDQCVSLPAWLSPLHYMRDHFQSDITLAKDVTEDNARVVVFKHADQWYVYTNSVRHCANMIEDDEVQAMLQQEPVAGR